MKTLKKISLSSLAKSELEDRELNKILGGENCCICPCDQVSNTLDNGNANHRDDWAEKPGYGSGSFG